LAAIGGTLGGFTGFSFLSFIEILYWIVGFFIWKKEKKEEVQDQPPPSVESGKTFSDLNILLHLPQSSQIITHFSVLFGQLEKKRKHKLTGGATNWTMIRNDEDFD
jgi:hypothetical protein